MYLYMSCVDSQSEAYPTYPVRCVNSHSGTCAADPLSFAETCSCFLAILPDLEPQERRLIHTLTQYPTDPIPKDIWFTVVSLAHLWCGQISFIDRAVGDSVKSIEIEFPAILINGDDNLRGHFHCEPLCSDQLSQAKYLLFHALLLRPRN